MRNENRTNQKKQKLNHYFMALAMWQCLSPEVPQNLRARIYQGFCHWPV